MKRYILFYLLFGIIFASRAQQEFHVTPNGNASGAGSLEKPWDLQTALNHPASVKDGDVIWLHGGIYRGRYVSKISAQSPNNPITIRNYVGEEVILDGNINSKAKSVLEVRGQNIVFQGFTVTFIGDYTRDANMSGFTRVDGVNHVSGPDCLFIDLKIHDNPGSGFGSWKYTNGTKIYDCIIFNNGFMSTAGRGGGVGLYIQNNSNRERVIENNIIFNNFYKGIEVWSANKNANEANVQNITLRNNVVFNNGSPAGGLKDNLIIASDDRNGINIPNNIKVLGNTFYHNTDIKNGQVGGDGASLTIGYNPNATPTNITLKNNVIIGRNNAFRLLHAKNLVMENNLAYCGYIHLDSSVLNHLNNWQLKENLYYTKKKKAFRIIKNNDYELEEWKLLSSTDDKSKWLPNKNFNNSSKLRIKRFFNQHNVYSVSVLDIEESSITLDFSKMNLGNIKNYTLYDAENPGEPMLKGSLNQDNTIKVDLDSKKIQKPKFNSLAQKSLSNFGVFIIEFETDEEKPIKEKSTLGKLFDWLGF